VTTSEDAEGLTDRIEELEVKVAFQEKAIEDLGETVLRQWRDLETLGRLVSRLEQRLADTQASLVEPGAPEPPPPHY